MKPGMDVHRPNQETPIENFYLAGSYTFQDYIDSMEGATKSGMLCADKILNNTEKLQKFKNSKLSGTVKLVDKKNIDLVVAAAVDTE